MCVIQLCILQYFLSSSIFNDHTADLVLKANMNSDKSLRTAAIFFISNFYLKQGIG